MKNKITIEDVGFWMDGGTITLKIKKNDSFFYEVEFVQKVFLEKSKREIQYKLFPGSLVLNNKELDIRSAVEKEILSEVKTAEFGIKIAESEKNSLSRIILEAVDFVESEEYITVAKKVGRIK
ncbi:hypothetical protein SGQ44_05265 [Flavobacterium sp. Fl-77]|uniref:Uncharacterized protein n=1 Tax=Flavobacterium flavipigmentatum TaxID=2893884 RepID=A0AAJ2SFI1_9FLAO|nr:MULTISPECIES: hypothetical protein [unclassified Flavobacterium]MDX6181813.1 hypothetical protein [Flavobacterium sp. Fl-33]MDX6185153.1 hypothetical protein [Flavobacterium sp. Fl-77]UFH37260.1 hypothetical protein LNP22_10995 [Flavobacterium sp. F-70]